MLGQVAVREDIRAMLRTLHPGSQVADFVTDVLMEDAGGFFPALPCPDGQPRHFVEIARLAATELRIAETALATLPDQLCARDDAQALTTRRLWAQLLKLRDRAQEMVWDAVLLREAAAPAPGDDSAASPAIARLLKARAKALAAGHAAPEPALEPEPEPQPHEISLFDTLPTGPFPPGAPRPSARAAAAARALRAAARRGVRLDAEMPERAPTPETGQTAGAGARGRT